MSKHLKWRADRETCMVFDPRIGTRAGDDEEEPLDLTDINDINDLSDMFLDDKDLSDLSQDLTDS